MKWLYYEDPPGCDKCGEPAKYRNVWSRANRCENHAPKTIADKPTSHYGEGWRKIGVI